MAKTTSHRRGIGLILMVMALLGLSLTATGILISSKWLLDQNNTNTTQAMLRKLARSISSTNLTPAGPYPRSYEQDVGALPTALADLTAKPGAVAACAMNTTTTVLSGWCGPYWSDAFQNATAFADGWGRVVVFDSAGRRVYSKGPNGVDETGGGDDLVQAF